MPTPRRTNNRAQHSVGSYAEVLLNQANLQEEENTANRTNQSLLLNPLPPRKRTAITQDVEDKSSKTDGQKGTAATVSNNSTHTTSAISTITQIDLDERFEQLRQEIKQEQDKAITKMKNELQADSPNNVPN